jgi:hypothetical protein
MPETNLNTSVIWTTINKTETMPTTTVKLATSNIQGISLKKNDDFQLIIFEYLIFLSWL